MSVVCLSVVCLSPIPSVVVVQLKLKKTERTHGRQNDLVSLNIYWVLSHIVGLSLYAQLSIAYAVLVL